MWPTRCQWRKSFFIRLVELGKDNVTTLSTQHHIKITRHESPSLCGCHNSDLTTTSSWFSRKNSSMIRPSLYMFATKAYRTIGFRNLRSTWRKEGGL